MLNKYIPGIRVYLNKVVDTNGGKKNVTKIIVFISNPHILVLMMMFISYQTTCLPVFRLRAAADARLLNRSEPTQWTTRVALPV